MTFEELRVSKALINALMDMDIVYPTAIQKKTFRKICSGCDIIAIANTGTGKTYAYLLPILEQLEFSNQKIPRVLIVVPTRELVMQIVEETKKLTKYKSIEVLGVYGGANINTQKNMIFNSKIDIIVGTPMRLFDLAVSGILKLSKIKKLIIDEVDEMFSLGFFPQIEQLIELLPKKRQNIMASATLSNEVESIVNKFFQTPEKILVESKQQSPESIKLIHIEVVNFNTKINLLRYYLLNNKNFKKNLVFVSTKKQADYLFEKLTKDFVNDIAVIHSNKSQNYRFNAIKKFEKANVRTLIATDVVAKGLDFTDVTHVFNLSLPDNNLDYIHRIGRTARIGQTGTSFLFFSPSEKENYYNIINSLNIAFDLLEMPKNVEISKILMEDEKTIVTQKQYLKIPDIRNSGGNIHEKKPILDIKRKKREKK